MIGISTPDLELRCRWTIQHAKLILPKIDLIGIKVHQRLPVSRHNRKSLIDGDKIALPQGWGRIFAFYNSGAGKGFDRVFALNTAHRTLRTESP